MTRTSGRSSGTLPKDTNVIYASLWAPEAALIAKQLPDVGLGKVKMIGPDGQFEPVDYIQAAGGAAEGNYVTFLAPDLKKIPAAAAFVNGVRGEVRTGQLLRPPRLRGGQHHPGSGQEGREDRPGGDPGCGPRHQGIQGASSASL